jgi:AcrR family transcriptional regulator
MRGISKWSYDRDRASLTESSINGVDRRRLILEAAVRVFARKGLHGARVGDIAAEAGVAHGLLYHYFKSKDELLETVFNETWELMIVTVRSVEEAGGTARDQLRRVAAIVLRTWKRDPDLVRVLIREVTRTSHLEQEVDDVNKAQAELQRIIETGQENGEFRTDVEARLAAVLFYGALEEFLTGWALGTLPDSDDDVDAAERTIVEIVTAGLLVGVTAEA